jgi:hypothetical protein
MIKLGSIVAWTLVVFGAIRTALALLFAFGVSNEDNAFVAARYFAAANTGEAIDESLVMFTAGVVIGLLVQIAKNGVANERK